MITIDLTGKAALVTGASQGLGLAIATRLHEAGAFVGVNYFADPAGVNRAQAEQVVASLGDRAIALAADVRDPAGVQAAIAQLIDAAGGLDIVVNNAGIIRDRTLKKMALDEW